MQKSYEHKLAVLATELDEWRAAQSRRRRIPEPFWVRAAELAGELGVSKVSTALRISFEGLKRRIPSLPSKATEGPTFLELLMGPQPPQASSCLIKVETASGARMQVEMANLSPSGLAEVLRGFVA